MSTTGLREPISWYKRIICTYQCSVEGTRCEQRKGETHRREDES